MDKSIAVNISRQIFFKSKIEDEIFYSQGATSFLIYLNGQLFAVTAAHVVKGYTPDSICIRYNYNEKYLLEFNDLFFYNTRTATITEDPEHTDVVFVRVSPEYFNDKINSGLIFNLDKYSNIIFEKDDFLLVTGFPREKNPIILEDKQIHHYTQSIKCYNIRKENYALCYGLYKFDLPRKVNEMGLDLNGVCGAPMFAYKRSGVYRGIAGIYLKENHLLEFAIVYKVLSTIVNSSPCKFLNENSLNLVG